MTDNVIPFPVPVNQDQPDRWAERTIKTETVDARPGLAYGYCLPPADAEHLPWTDVVLGKGPSDWTR